MVDSLYTLCNPACMPITYLPLGDAARDLGVAASTLRHQIRLRRMAATKIGRGWFVTPTEVDRYRAVSLREKGES